jgi:hypothetical protein
MIYTKGPKTASFTENRTFVPPEGDTGIRCLTSLYPIPIYCEGPSLPCQQFPCQKALLYSTVTNSLSIAAVNFFFFS